MSAMGCGLSALTRHCNSISMLCHLAENAYRQAQAAADHSPCWSPDKGQARGDPAYMEGCSSAWSGHRSMPTQDGVPHCVCEGWVLRGGGQTVCTYPGQRAIDCGADEPLRCSCGKRWFVCNDVVVMRMQIGPRLGRRELTSSCCWLCKDSACQTVYLKCNFCRINTDFAETCHVLDMYCTGLMDCVRDGHRLALLCHRLRWWDPVRRRLSGSLSALRPFLQLARPLCQVWGTPTLLEHPPFCFVSGSEITCAMTSAKKTRWLFIGCSLSRISIKTA